MGWDRDRRRLAFYMGVMAVAAAGIGLFAASLVPVDEPWDPLGDFPEQTVLVDVDAAGRKTVRADSGFVPVEGTKNYDEKVMVISTLGWRCTDPTLLVEVLSGSATRQSGSLTQTFENPIPNEIFDALARRAVPSIDCVIFGIETPIDPEGERQGIPRSWETEQFTVVM